MNLAFRPEEPTDYDTITTVIRDAFSNVAISQKDEHKLVQKLRHTKSYIPELSLVAIVENKIIGHIFFTKLTIENEKEIHSGLALAPVSVINEYQKKGIGSQLILNAHKKAIKMNFPFSIVIGHEDYYPKFGYSPFDQNKIILPFKVPSENAMIKYFDNTAVGKIEGYVRYDSAFLSQ